MTGKSRSLFPRRIVWTLGVFSVRCTTSVASYHRLAPQVNPLKTINLADIERIQVLYDDGRAVLLHLKSRVVQLLLRDAAPFVQAIQKNLKVCVDVAGSPP